MSRIIKAQSAKEHARLERARLKRRIGIIRRCRDLIAELQAIHDDLNDPARSDRELQQHVKAVNALWARRLGSTQLDTPAWIALVNAVETWNESLKKALKGINLLEGREAERARALALDRAAGSARELFAHRWAEYGETVTDADFVRAFMALHSRSARKWDVLRELARKCGVQVPSAAAMKVEWSKHQRWLRARDQQQSRKQD